MRRSPFPAASMALTLARSVGQSQPRAGVMLAAICATALMAGPTLAQPSPGIAPPPPPAGGPMGDHAMHPMRPALINVTGTGEASVAPDLAVITIGVTVQAPTAGEAMSQNATRQQTVIDAIKQRGIEARDIQTSNLSLSPVQDYSEQGKPPVITGYQAGNMVTIRVRDLPQLGPILDAIVAAGANEVQGISFQRDDAGQTEAEARRNAVHNARERAEVIAAAAGQRLGRLVALSDTQGQVGPPRPMMMRADMAGAASKTPLEAGELRMSADVTATWEMVPLGAPDGGALPPPPISPSEDEGDGGTPIPAVDPASATAPAASPAATAAPTTPAPAN